MLKKSITYDNYDGEPVTEDFWFHLTKAELLELTLSKGDGFDAYLAKIAKTNDASKILPLFREIISLTVGKRDEVAKRFIKNSDISQEFMSSEAFSEMFLEFMKDPDTLVQFIRGVLPKGLAEQIDFESGQFKVSEDTTTAKQIETVELPKEKTFTDEQLEDRERGDYASSKVKAFEEYTDAELMAMPMADFDKLTTGDPRKMTREQLQMAFRRQMQVNTIKE